MTYLVTFANKLYKKPQKSLSSYAQEIGVHPMPFTEKWLKDQSFYRENAAILSQRRGCGYWLWKPYIIYTAMQRTPKNSLIIYLDSGDTFDKQLIDHVKKTLSGKDNYCLLAAGLFSQSQWTKRDCFVYMNCDEEKYWNASHLEAGFSAWKNGPASQKIIQEWLSYSKDERILTDIDNQCGFPNFPDFNGHRHDQSILTNLAVKYKLPITAEVSQWISTNHSDPKNRFCNLWATLRKII